MSYIPLFVIVALAFVIPMLSEKLRIPAVVGEVLCGVFLGFLGFSVSEAHGVAFLADFGFVFLMFLAGLQMDFSQTSVRNARLFLLSALIYSLTLGISTALMHILGLPFYLALAFSTSSVGLAVSTTRELGISTSEYGQVILINAFIADFSTLLILTVLTMQIERGISFDLLLILLLFLLFLVLYFAGKVAVWRFPEPVSALFDASRNSELGVRASFALLLVFVVLSEIVGVEAVLGAFLAGIMISLLGGGTLLEQKLYGIGYGFLIPIFFINVGISANLTLISDGIYILPSLLLVAFTAKILPSLLLLTRYSLKKSISAGILLSSRLSLMIAIATILLKLHLIDNKMASAIIILAIITSIVCPTAFKNIVAANSHLFMGYSRGGG